MKKTKNITARKIIFMMVVSVITILATAMSSLAFELQDFDGASTNLDDYVFYHDYNGTTPAIQDADTGQVITEKDGVSWITTDSTAFNPANSNTAKYWYDQTFTNNFTMQDIVMVDSYHLGLSIDLTDTSGGAGDRNIRSMTGTVDGWEIRGSDATIRTSCTDVNDWLLIQTQVDITNRLANLTAWTITNNGDGSTSRTLCGTSTGWMNYLTASDVISIQYAHDFNGGASAVTINESSIWYWNATDADRSHMPGTLTPPTSPPTIDILFPVNNEIKNQDPLQIDFTHTIDPTAVFSNITLEVNGTLNQTSLTITNLTVDLSDGLYDFTLTINDDIGTDSSTVTNVRIDRTNPFSDHAMKFYTGRVLANSENTTITFQNSNLSTSLVNITNALNQEVFSEEHIDIHSAIDTIVVNVDIASFGPGTFTITSNVSDVPGNLFSTQTTIEIIGPTANSLACDYGSGFTTCIDTDEGGTLEQVQLNCQNATSSLASLSLNTTPLFSNQAMTQLGDIFTYDNPDETIIIGIYNVSAVCSNPADTSFIQTSFNGTVVIPTPPAIPTGNATLSGFDYDSFLSWALVLIVLGGVVTALVTRFKGGKK